MRAALIHLALGLFAFLGGAVGAVFVLMQFDLELDRQLDMLRFGQDFAPEIDVAMNLHQIQAAQEGNTDWLIMWNCWQMSQHLRHVNPQIFDGEKRASVEDLIEKAHRKFQELNEQQLCGSPVTEELNQSEP